MSDSIRYALAVNAAVTGVKLVASAVTGSPAMMAETAHSLVDCTTQALLWVGDVRGETRPAAPYRWGIGAAVTMFASGGVYSIVTGVRDLVDPVASSSTFGWVALIVLGIASTLELSSMVNAVRALSSSRNGATWARHLRTTSDTASKTVVVEDGADILGNILAAAGIALSLTTGATWIDAAAGILVGCLLIVLAAELATHNVRMIRTVSCPA